MEYIINPKMFYIVSVLDSIKKFMFWINVVLLTALFATAVVVFCYVAIGDNDPEDVIQNLTESGKKHKKRVWIAVIAFWILACIFVPSGETITKMCIAKLATRENLEMTVDAVKAAADYIVDAAKSLK